MSTNIDNLRSEATSLEQRMLSLISKANNTTGKNDTDLTSGVNSLVEGYGKGGGSNKFAEIFNGTVTAVTAEDLKGVTEIRRAAFMFCTELKSIELPTGLTSIGGWAFRDCTLLAKIVIPSSVQTINTYAFTNCSSLSSVVFGENSQLTFIGSYAFLHCSSLASIVFPSGLTEIDTQAFGTSTNLKTLDFSKCKAVPTLGTGVFNAIPTTCRILIPSALYNTWKAATNWSNYAKYMVAV